MIDDVVRQLPHILAILVVFIAAPLTWYVTALLWQMSSADHEGEALRVAAVLSTCVALTVTVFALVFINNGMSTPVLSSRDTMLLSRSALLILSVVPSLYWIRWYRRRNGGHP